MVRRQRIGGRKGRFLNLATEVNGSDYVSRSRATKRYSARRSRRKSSTTGSRRRNRWRPPPPIPRAKRLASRAQLQGCVALPHCKSICGARSLVASSCGLSSSCEVPFDPVAYDAHDERLPSSPAWIYCESLIAGACYPVSSGVLHAGSRARAVPALHPA
jgi:hypothetical protein